MPRQQTTGKKGTPSWKPAGRLRAVAEHPGYRQRWCSRDPDNLRRKEEEGWVPVNSVTGSKAEHDAAEDIHGGTPLDSSQTYRELLLMEMPEETAQAREAYYREKTHRQTIGVKKEAAKELAKVGAPTHGRVIIE